MPLKMAVNTNSELLLFTEEFIGVLKGFHVETHCNASLLTIKII